jgi:spartin
MSYSDPKLLYSIGGIRAYHIQNGTEESLTPSGPQTLSLLMVPTSSPFAGLSNADPQSEAPEEDFYLHLHLPPELDLPLPATTQIYHQPPSSYLIPRWDLGPDSGAFTRIEFPIPGAEKISQDDIDTFETILAQCTAFLERAPAPGISDYKSGKGGKNEYDALPQYNPSDYGPGEGYVGGSPSSKHGQIVLIDEENGSVVGELGEGFNIIEDKKMLAGSKGRTRCPNPRKFIRIILTKSQTLLRSVFRKTALRTLQWLLQPPSISKQLCTQPTGAPELFLKPQPHRAS